MRKIHLGIHYGHNATVAVVENGRLIFCQSEERLNRIKNTTGFPRQTIDYIYHNICRPEDIQTATLFQESILGYLFLKARNFKPFQYGHYLSPDDDIGGIFHAHPLRWRLNQLRAKYMMERNQKLRDESLAYFSSELKVPVQKILHINHHLAHTWSAIPNVQEWGDTLLFTLDGQGDGICATVSRLTDSDLKILASNDHYHSLGYYYSAITALLGMKSGEHEFKVMGLAPYARKRYYSKLLERMKSFLRINESGSFHSTISPNALRERLGSLIRYQRFDNVAGAIQEMTEDLIKKWIFYWVEKTGVRNIAVAGGVFMNVKACQRLLEGGIVDKMFVVPSAADESTAIGAAFWASRQKEPDVKLHHIKDLYLGMSFSDKETETAFKKMQVSERYEISKPDGMNKKVAKLLASNEVVARCTGPMEFGARALGNRSILANPSRFENLELINSAIKNRDFWMPFTPSILEGDMNRYIVNADRIFAPYMCITFDTTPEARRDLAAAIHARDKTARPQCVLQEWNPEYYDLISAFKGLTGIGGVLNTSFNLHGEPNVCSPEDAIHTMDKSGLIYLTIGSYLLKKKVHNLNA
nr:carbamoyltransferase C-terminal domain-containing protein [uncultured Desulfobacter sp.]